MVSTTMMRTEDSELTETKRQRISEWLQHRTTLKEEYDDEEEQGMRPVLTDTACFFKLCSAIAIVPQH